MWNGEKEKAHIHSTESTQCFYWSGSQLLKRESKLRAVLFSSTLLHIIYVALLHIELNNTSDKLKVRFIFERTIFPISTFSSDKWMCQIYLPICYMAMWTLKITKSPQSSAVTKNGIYSEIIIKCWSSILDRYLFEIWLNLKLETSNYRATSKTNNLFTHQNVFLLHVLKCADVSSLCVLHMWVTLVCWSCPKHDTFDYKTCK